MNVIVMLNVITFLEDIIAPAKLASLGMALNAKVIGSIRELVESLCRDGTDTTHHIECPELPNAAVTTPSRYIHIFYEFFCTC